MNIFGIKSVYYNGPRVASGAMVSALALYSDDPGSNLGLLNSLLNLIQFKKN